MAKPKHFITDKLPFYNEAVKNILNESTHIPVPPMSSDTNNNLIYIFILYYNFIRPHGSLNDSTTAEVSGFSTNDSNKHNWFIAA